LEINEKFFRTGADKLRRKVLYHFTIVAMELLTCKNSQIRPSQNASALQELSRAFTVARHVMSSDGNKQRL